jgi:hypothetical protein
MRNPLTAALLTCLLSGCYTPPEVMPLIGQTPPLREQFVRLENGYPEETPATNNYGFQGRRPESDYPRLTDNALDLLSRYLVRSGVSTDIDPVPPEVIPGAQASWRRPVRVRQPPTRAMKTVTLRVSNARATTGRAMSSVVVLEARTGDGTNISVSGSDRLPVSDLRSIERSTRAAVIALMNDRQFVTYLNRD